MAFVRGTLQEAKRAFKGFREREWDEGHAGLAKARQRRAAGWKTSIELEWKALPGLAKSIWQDYAGIDNRLQNAKTLREQAYTLENRLRVDLLEGALAFTADSARRSIGAPGPGAPHPWGLATQFLNIVNQQQFNLHAAIMALQNNKAALLDSGYPPIHDFPSIEPTDDELELEEDAVQRELGNNITQLELTVLNSDIEGRPRRALHERELAALSDRLLAPWFVYTTPHRRRMWKDWSRKKRGAWRRSPLKGLSYKWRNLQAADQAVWGLHVTRLRMRRDRARAAYEELGNPWHAVQNHIKREKMRLEVIDLEINGLTMPNDTRKSMEQLRWSPWSILGRGGNGCVVLYLALDRQGNVRDRSALKKSLFYDFDEQVAEMDHFHDLTRDGTVLEYYWNREVERHAPQHAILAYEPLVLPMRPGQAPSREEGNMAWYMPMQYMPHGDLESLISNHARLVPVNEQTADSIIPEPFIWFLIHRMATTLDRNASVQYPPGGYMAGNPPAAAPLVHSDIKTSNILLGAAVPNSSFPTYPTPFVADWGLAFSGFTNNTEAYRGTRRFRAPEMETADHNGGQLLFHTYKADIWCMAVTVWCAMKGLRVPPFLLRHERRPYNPAFPFARYPVNGDNRLTNFYSSELRQLVDDMMQLDRRQRPDYPDIIDRCETQLDNLDMWEDDWPLNPQGNTYANLAFSPDRYPIGAVPRPD